MRPLLLSALALFFVGCGGTALPTSLGDCADGTDLTWTEIEPILEANCLRCHDSALTGPTDRQQAPANSNYDTPQAARSEPDTTWFNVQSGRMPNDAVFTSDADALDLHEWLSCGGPE